MVQPLFNVDKIRSNRRYARDHIGDHGFLFDKMSARILDNLQDIHRDFNDILIVGERGCMPILTHFKDKNVTVYDVVNDGNPEIPDCEPQSFDCVISMGYMHVVNDVQGFLKSIKSYLKPDGLFLSAFCGGVTLHELRQSIMAVELEQKNGVSQHIHPMIDHYQFAGLLQAAQFALPVVDYDRTNVLYGDLDDLYTDLKNMGEGNSLLDRKSTLHNIKKDVDDYCKNHFYDDGYQATFDILYGIGWAPHDNQQKPAKRGSGQVSLTEIL